MMVMHTHPGSASPRHVTVTPRARARPIFVHPIHRPDPSDELAESIVGFAMRAEGRQVGDGECFALADQALSQAGARSAGDYTEITPDGDYVWGRPVPLAAARPGDILQFRNFRIVRRVTTTSTSEDGAASTTQSQEVEERDHHTAIVTQNLGTSLIIAEQNVEPLGRVVQRNTIEIATGTTTRAAESNQTSTEVFVDGAVRAYRPQHATTTRIAQATQPGS